ncbi:hypothetical protein ACIBI8_05445 [Streptomyces sp. NPDC050529]|uniref:hypothetical protein n=1 Tax=unclassified Streptomyces TaxID=2593676 RepID=UPI002DDB3DCD|nr:MULTISPECIES: hypothetical protein [unclassified Streptomyces]WRZ80030.1 hypothetical protein OG316_07065 [Streptomyces sp. NBC_01022]
MRNIFRFQAKGMKRSLISLGAAVMAVGGANLALAPSAFAGGYGCSGSLVHTQNLLVSGKVWSTGYIYYSTANGGTNCIVLVAKKYAGTPHYMYVSLSVDGRSGTKKDEGRFSSYAGPVTQTNTNGHCVSSTLWENSPNDEIQAGWPIDHVACG